MPGDSAGQIGLDLVVNQGPFRRQMAGITGLAKKAGAALAAAFATKQIINFGKQCLELGSNLSEVQNVVDVTFPNMTAQVDAFAKSAAASFGLSETMAKKYTGTFGAMAKSFGFTERQAHDMSTTLTGLAGDVASFYNIAQDEAYTKLKSVFTGETETLKELGVVMTQSALDAYAMANGFGKTTSAMSEAEKVALRYAFVQDKLSAAQGDFARTSDSWANQTRILKLQFDSLKATIGQGLINLFTPVIKVINALIGKLTTLANAFKSFTELITGKKSGVGSMASDAQSASAGLGDAAESAGNLADNTSDVGTAAKKAVKDMKALMGFDKINKLDSQDDGSGSSGGTSGVSSGVAVDYGSLAEGETVVDKLKGRMDGLIERCKELAGLFKKGFTIGFGDSKKRIQGIKNSIEGIGKSLKEIATDPNVVSSFDGMIDSIAQCFGKITGSMASIGITIASNLLGGINKYLGQNSEYIRQRISGIFDIQGEIADLTGDIWVALADILSVFSSDTARQITADLIGIFADGFLGVTELSLKFSRDVISTITGPFVDNKDTIKETIQNFLEPVSTVVSTIHGSIKTTFEQIGKVYDEHVKPMFDAFREGFSEVLKVLLDGYNKHIAPVLNYLADKFQKVWEEHVQPCLNSAAELIGKVADLVKTVWQTVLQPVIKWIAEKIMPAIAPVIKWIGDKVIDTIGNVSDVIGGVIKALGGVIDFITDVFKGDWDKAWEDIKEIFSGVWEAFIGIVRTPVNTILGFINSFLKGIETMVNGVANALNTISIDLPGWLQELTGYESVGFNLPNWIAPQIPYLAQGGFVERNTPRLAMIGDNKRYGEIVAPEDKMQEMVDAAVASVRPGITREELELVVNNAVMRLVAALASVGFNLDGEQLATLQRVAQTGVDRRYNTVTVTI